MKTLKLIAVILSTNLLCVGIFTVSYILEEAGCTITGRITNNTDCKVLGYTKNNVCGVDNDSTGAYAVFTQNSSVEIVIIINNDSDSDNANPIANTSINTFPPSFCTSGCCDEYIENKTLIYLNTIGKDDKIVSASLTCNNPADMKNVKYIFLVIPLIFDISFIMLCRESKKINSDL